MPGDAYIHFLMTYLKLTAEGALITVIQHTQSGTHLTLFIV